MRGIVEEIKEKYINWSFSGRTGNSEMLWVSFETKASQGFPLSWPTRPIKKSWRGKEESCVRERGRPLVSVFLVNFIIKKWYF